MTPAWQTSGLISDAPLATLPPHTKVSTSPFDSSAFHLGAFTSDTAWKSFAAAANLSSAPALGKDQMAVFVILDSHTNGLGVNTVAAKGDELVVTLEWDGIEPLWVGRTPGAFVIVDRAGLKTVRVRTTQHGTPADDLGVFPVP